MSENVQKELTSYQSEKDIEKIYLSLNSHGSVKVNCLRNFGRWLYGDHLNIFIFNLGLWLKRR